MAAPILVTHEAYLLIWTHTFFSGFTPRVSRHDFTDSESKEIRSVSTHPPSPGLVEV